MTDREKLIAVLSYMDGAIANSENCVVFNVNAYKDFIKTLIDTVDNTENK